MDDQAFIQFLWDTGHFWNRAYPEVLNVREADLPTLTMADRVVQFAVASFQQSDINLFPLVQAHHKRAPLFDGLAGPATLELATLDRCPLPDHAPPPGATFDYGDADLNRAVESMQATGSGSWPAGCYTVQGVHEVKISYDPSRMSSKQQEWLPEVKKLSAEAVAAVGVRLVEVPVNGGANITVYGKVLSGSVIGMAEFNGGRCGDVVFCQLNPNFAPSMASFLKLLLHENGHNWNLEHRSGNIMNPSIMPDSLPNHWIQRAGGAVIYQDNSYPTLKGFFGGAPLTPPTPPGPPVKPNEIRLAKSLAAGTYGDLTLGSTMGPGDYMMFLAGDGPPPPVT